LIPLLLNPAYAVNNNTLQEVTLVGESAVISVYIEFGADTVRQGIARDWITNHLDDITLEFYGDEVPLREPEIRVTSTGNHFRISSAVDGILIYGHKNAELGNYKINVYFSTDKGLIKFPTTSAIPFSKEKIIETEITKEKTPYVADLCMTSSHDFRTYWMQNFDINIQSFDCNINSDPKSSSDFHGRIDGVDVKVLISLDDNPVATLSGVTANNGHWDGEWYFPANISPPGEYDVDVILSYLDQTITKTTTMFVINMVIGSDSSNHSPVADAGEDDEVFVNESINLNGSKSSDPDGDTITYSWIQLSGVEGTLTNSKNAIATFTATEETGNAEFQLAVTDRKGVTSTDTISILVREPDPIETPL